MKFKMHRLDNPLVLASSVLVLSVLLMFMLERTTHNEVIPWRIAATSLIFFSAASQMGGLFVKNWLRYIAISLVCFILMIMILLPVAHWISALPLRDLLYMKSMYVLAGIFYFLLNGLAGVFRVIHWMLKTNEDL